MEISWYHKINFTLHDDILVNFQYVKMDRFSFDNYLNGR